MLDQENSRNEGQSTQRGLFGGFRPVYIGLFFFLVLVLCGVVFYFSTLSTSTAAGEYGDEADMWEYYPSKPKTFTSGTPTIELPLLKFVAVFFMAVSCVLCFASTILFAHKVFQKEIIEHFTTRHVYIGFCVLGVFFALHFVSLFVGIILFLLTSVQICGIFFFLVGVALVKRTMKCSTITKFSLYIILSWFLGYFMLPIYNDKSVKEVRFDRAVPLKSHKTFSTNPISTGSAVSFESPSFDAEKTLGLSAGGSKDAANFRDNIENDYVPLETDISYEGVFYDYFFETGKNTISLDCDEGQLFCPYFATASSYDPFTGEIEHYLSLGLDSGIRADTFKRKKLNLVILLDISGSMSSQFDLYYYGNKQRIKTDEMTGKSKMELASETICALLDHLEPSDSFGLVLFNSAAHLANPLQRISTVNMASLKKHIMEIKATGSTFFSSGYRMSSELFELEGTGKEKFRDPKVYENRIIVVTDAMPNVGEVGQDNLGALVADNAKNKIYTSFIGVGLDFNTELVSNILKTRGANYFSVHSASEFKKRLAEEFEYLVTPLLFDMKFQLLAHNPEEEEETNYFVVEKVYGSPAADETTGDIFTVDTMFPAAKNENDEARGGVILAKIGRKEKNVAAGQEEKGVGNSNNRELKFVISYEDRSGVKFFKQFSQRIDFDTSGQEQYSNTGIRKAIVLSRYVNIMKNWIIDERKHAKQTGLSSSMRFLMTLASGIKIPPIINKEGSDSDSDLGIMWERGSVKLHVFENYRRIFEQFLEYLDMEETALDEDFGKERKILSKLSM